MIKNVLELLVPQLKAIRWMRVAAAGVVGVFVLWVLWSLWNFIWTGRPQEFYQNGYMAGVNAESARQNEVEGIIHAKVTEKLKHTNKQREKILSAPAYSPDALFDRMRNGGL